MVTPFNSMEERLFKAGLLPSLKGANGLLLIVLLSLFCHVVVGIQAQGFAGLERGARQPRTLPEVKRLESLFRREESSRPAPSTLTIPKSELSALTRSTSDKAATPTTTKDKSIATESDVARSGSRTESTESKATFSSGATAVAGHTVIPQVFDTGISNNFTSSCQSFLNGFIQDKRFQRCVPLSLLLQTSNGFFQAEKAFFNVTAVLSASCEVEFDTCNNMMQSLAAQLTDQSNCASDWNQDNPLVMTAYYGLVSYKPMYQAGCQKDRSGNYCFANAVANRSNTADVYPYYLPLANAMPGGARPTCGECLKQTMDIFANAATNSTQPISRTYPAAAQQINIGCGPSWVDTTVQITSAASPTVIPPLVAMTTLFALLLAYFV